MSWNEYQKGDCSEDFFETVKKTTDLVIDTETEPAPNSEMDCYNPFTKKLQIVSVYDPNTYSTSIIHFPEGANKYAPVRLRALLLDNSIQKCYQHAMFDVRFIYNWLNILPENNLCTRIAHKIIEPNAKSHSLANNLKKYLGIEINKGIWDYETTFPDWTTYPLKPIEKKYCINDISHVHALWVVLLRQANEKQRHLILRNCAHIHTQVENEIDGYQDPYPNKSGIHTY